MANTSSTVYINPDKAQRPYSLKHVGHGPSGIAAYVLTDKRGRTILRPGRAFFIMTYEEATAFRIELEGE